MAATKEYTVLIVDDEPPVLSALSRLFNNEPWRIVTAPDAKEAVDILSQTEVAVLLSDYCMPGEDGLQLLKSVKSSSPDMVRILMTGFAELDVAVQAINEGEVFKFVVKPWNDEELSEIVRDAINRYHFTRAMRSSDEATLRSLAQTIELKDVYTRGHCERVTHYAVRLAENCGAGIEQLRFIRHGCWLHDCGKIGVPDTILNKKGPLTAEEYKLIKNHPTWGMEVAQKAGLNQSVLDVIQYHHERFDGSGYPSALAGHSIPFEARITAIADVYDALTTDRAYRGKYTQGKALSIMKAEMGKGFDPKLLEAFQDTVKSMPPLATP